MPGLNFPEVSVPMSTEFSGAIAQSALRADARMRDQLLAQQVRTEEGSTLYAYFINHPHLDYWVWNELLQQIKRYISDYDATHPATFFSLNPDLVYGTASSADEKLLALFETIKRYYQAIHYAVGTLANAMLWANQRNFGPISERLMSKLKVTTVETLAQQLDGFPVNGAAYDYYLRQQRVLEFKSFDGKLQHAYPLYIYELGSCMEDQGGNTNGPGRRAYFPVISELHDGDIDLTDADGTGSCNLQASYGAIANALYHGITRTKDYLLTTLGFEDHVIDIGTKLRELFAQMGIFDREFNFRQLLNDVNSQPLYDGWDFVKKMMIFADRPRPVIKHHRLPAGQQIYPTTDSDAKNSIFKLDPIDWILEAGDPRTRQPNDTDGILSAYEKYEWVAVKPAATEAQKAAIVDAYDWDNANAQHSLEAANLHDDNVLVGEDQLEKVLEQWWQPYHDFYLPDPTFFDDIMNKTAEEGKVMLVLDEVGAGVLMPRYPTMPTINNMDMYQCGFYAVVSYEQPAEPWAAWALLYELDPDGTPDTPWADEDASSDDGLVWVGSGIGQLPQYVIHHYLAVQGSFWGDSDNTDWDGSTYLRASESIAPVPIPIFTYHWFQDSIAFTVATDHWDDTNLNWEEAAEAILYSHTFEITSADRRALCYALDYPDPHRPYRVRFANLIQASEGLYKKMLSDIRTDWGSLYSSPQIATVPIDKDNSRYISAFRRPSVRRESKPLRATSSQSERKRPSVEAKSFRERVSESLDPGAAADRISGLVSAISDLDARGILDAVKGMFDASLAGVIIDYITADGTNANNMRRRARAVEGKTEDEVRKMLRAK
jgi:hypothetical protein